MTRAGVFAGLLAVCLFLFSCGTRVYRNDLPAADLAGTLCEAAGIADPVAAGAEDLVPLPASFGEDPQVALFYAADGADLDEIGVWYAGEANARSVAVFLQSRLTERYENNKAYYDSYLPGQTAKLRDAEVRVYGAYVIWTILSPEDKAVCFDAAENALAS